MGGEASKPEEPGMDSHEVTMEFGRGAQRAHVGYTKKGKSIVKVYRKKGKTGRYFSNGKKLQAGKRVCRKRSGFGACKRRHGGLRRHQKKRKKCKKGKVRDSRTKCCRNRKKPGRRKRRTPRAPRYSVEEPTPMPEPAFGRRMMRPPMRPPMPRFGARPMPRFGARPMPRLGARSGASPMPRFGKPISASAIRKFRPISF